MASEEKKVEGTSTTEAKPVDERAVSLAKAQETALEESARRESEIEASKTLKVYAYAGLAHVETVRCWKASEDYACEKRGVATSWNPARYDSAIGQITVRVRATNPELFEDFDALAEKPKLSPSNSNERIGMRLRVGILYELLVTLIGDKVGSLPYRLAANYLIGPAILTFSKQDVAGSIHEKHAEFLKTQLGILCDGQSSSASFLASLKQHYADLEKEEADKASANLTPEQRKLQETAKKAAKEGADTQEKVSKVRKGLATYLAEACAGMVSPDEIAGMINGAIRKAEISLPLVVNPKTVTKDELNAFLRSVSVEGGRSKEERRALIMTIVRHGSMLAEQASKRKLEAQANGKPQLQAASAN